MQSYKITRGAGQVLAKTVVAANLTEKRLNAIVKIIPYPTFSYFDGFFIFLLHIIPLPLYIVTKTMTDTHTKVSVPSPD